MEREIEFIYKCIYERFEVYRSAYETKCKIACGLLQD
jgi:hypothetical protein